MRPRAVWLCVLALTGCGSSLPGNIAVPVPEPLPAACAPAATDHSADSLPDELVPRPGPDALYLPPPRAPQLENTGEWRAPPILVSGASAYRCGEFLYQDWIYDDRGAAGILDPNDPHSATDYLFSPRAGTLTYPTDPVYASNAADFVELRVKPLADATLFRITLNTLQDVSRVAFTLALGDSAQARNWPHGAATASPAALFLSVLGGRAELLDAASGAPLAEPDLTIDTERRQFELRVPHAVWNPGSGVVRIAAGVGLWDAAGNAYLAPSLVASASAPGGLAPGGSTLFNLAFRSAEPTPDFTVYGGRTIADAAVLAKVQAHWWRERAQADALAAGDAGAFFASVDFGKLARAENDESGVPQTGFMNRLFASRYVFGQGMDYARACGGISAARPCDGAMVGQLQPYAIYIPQKPQPAGGYGLTLLLHALSANLNQYLGSRHAQQLGERGAGSLVVTPAGRGPDGFYFEVAEADVFEVWADVARHYRLDPDWTVMSGVSMGGIGTYRLAPRYPDLFARLMPIVAASSHEELLPSLRNVPLTAWSSLLDELQPVISTEGTVSALTDLQYRFDSLRFDTWDHLTPSTNDYYQPGADFLGEALVERDPVRITYVLSPAEDDPRVDVVADRAYWISGLALRDAALATGTVDVRSGGFGLADAAPQAVVQSQAVLSGGYHEPAPYTRRVIEWEPPAAAPVADRLTIVARNIATLTVNPQRARISCDAQLVIDSDGPLQVTLDGCQR